MKNTSRIFIGPSTARSMVQGCRGWNTISPVSTLPSTNNLRHCPQTKTSSANLRHWLWLRDVFKDFLFTPWWNGPASPMLFKWVEATIVPSSLVVCIVSWRFAPGTCDQKWSLFQWGHWQTFRGAGWFEVGHSTIYVWQKRMPENQWHFEEEEFRCHKMELVDFFQVGWQSGQFPGRFEPSSPCDGRNLWRRNSDSSIDEVPVPWKNDDDDWSGGWYTLVNLYSWLENIHVQ